jgi:uncharacterized protein YbjT (DUF2867 family)
MGQQLVPQLLRRGHQVQALVRHGSQGKLPAGCVAIVGNALERQTYAHCVRPADTFVHLIGLSHPNLSKAEQFRGVDLVSVREAVAAAVQAGVEHFVYVSVAQPAPVMKAYQQVRAQCEQMIRNSGLNSTIVRPWYVLGPGHRWPYLLVPIYRLFELIPTTREAAQRLGLVTLPQMVSVLLRAIENPVIGVRVLGVPEIRESDFRVSSPAPIASWPSWLSRLPTACS